jgi:hypothetical protein
MKAGDVARLWRVGVRRLDRFSWEVDHGPAQLLLPAIDELMKAAGFKAATEEPAMLSAGPGPP